MSGLKKGIWLLFVIFAGCGNGNSTEHASNDTIIIQSNVTKPDLADMETNEDTVSKTILTGKYDPASDTNFVKIGSIYTSKPSIYMQQEAYEAFVKMADAAKEAGISLQILSATRNFDYQKGIWERKWNGQTAVEGKNLKQTIPDPVERAKKILEFSSMPGTSRHHWGTDIDLNNLTNEWFESGEGKKVYEWLTANAGKYGFCQPYSPKGDARPHGYNEEKWHWSYKPLADEYLEQYLERVTYADITGFAGDEVAEDVQAIDHYVAGVSDACK